MRKKTYAALIGVLLLTLSCLYVSAEVIVGTKKWISISSAYTLDSQPGMDRVPNLGFDGGVFAEIGFSRRFGIETGLLFAQRGVREEGDFFSYTWVATYFDIPLLTKIKFAFLDGLLRTSILLGPQLSFALGSEFHEEQAGMGGPGGDPEVKPFDVGFAIGVEGAVRLADVYYLFLDVRYVLGFLPVVGPEDTGGQNPRSSMLSVLAGIGFRLF
jgi:hypothetical protein